jgi:hypothetical protein
MYDWVVRYDVTLPPRSVAPRSEPAAPTTAVANANLENRVRDVVAMIRT